MDFADELKTIDICAIGPLRVTAALVKAQKLQAEGKIIFITSQGGSIEWRDVQCPSGGDYGHHMSKAGHTPRARARPPTLSPPAFASHPPSAHADPAARARPYHCQPPCHATPRRTAAPPHYAPQAAANMGAKLAANELKDKYAVGIFHPGFNKTGMTAKCEPPPARPPRARTPRCPSAALRRPFPPRSPFKCVAARLRARVRRTEGTRTSGRSRAPWTPPSGPSECCTR